MRIKAAIAVAAVLAALGVSACSPVPAQQPYMPASWPTVTSTVGVATYCPYVYSPAEVIGCTGTPVAFRPVPPSAADLIATAVWVHYLTYASSYYYTDAYYRRNIYGHAHITYVNVRTYESIGSSFNSRYASQEHRYTPKFRDSHGKVVTGSKYGRLNNGIVKQLPASGRKPAGGVRDPGTANSVTGGKPPVTVKRPPVTVKRPPVTVPRLPARRR